MKKQSSTLYVSGRFGFIGPWIVKRIVESGEDIIVFDIVEKYYAYRHHFNKRSYSNWAMFWTI